LVFLDFDLGFLDLVLDFGMRDVREGIEGSE
jgi:hypothetical protein